VHLRLLPDIVVPRALELAVQPVDRVVVRFAAEDAVALGVGVGELFELLCAFEEVGEADLLLEGFLWFVRTNWGAIAIGLGLRLRLGSASEGVTRRRLTGVTKVLQVPSGAARARGASEARGARRARDFISKMKEARKKAKANTPALHFFVLIC
jgi:hypothetical protein